MLSASGQLRGRCASRCSSYLGWAHFRHCVGGRAMGSEFDIAIYLCTASSSSSTGSTGSRTATSRSTSPPACQRPRSPRSKRGPWPTAGWSGHQQAKQASCGAPSHWQLSSGRTCCGAQGHGGLVRAVHRPRRHRGRSGLGRFVAVTNGCCVADAAPRARTVCGRHPPLRADASRGRAHGPGRAPDARRRNPRRVGLGAPPSSTIDA